MATTVTRNGQITLDANIRKEMGIEVGTPLEVNRMGEIIIIAKKDKGFWDRHKPVLPKGFDHLKLRNDSTKRYEKMFGK